MSAATHVLTDEQLVQTIDEMMSTHFKPNAPGAAVIVTRHGQPVFRKGYGMANVELGVPVAPHMVFRLGSITKQFTAVCILMLAQQGKLDLQDEITKFLPDYPTQAHRITIEHLLTHTSGIKSYTNVPAFLESMRKDMSLEELINSFKLLPMEFAPGEQFNYNNSAYVMLGAVIEKASGQTYAEFLKQHVFEPLGMKDSYFDMPTPIIPGRVAGYKPAGEGFENADYISMTLPHAAGSLASTVDDMARWDAALYTDTLVKQEWLQKAWTPYVLNNGTPTGYGYGWAIGRFEGNYFITHGGGINGFITDGYRFPEEGIYVCILTNCQQMIPDDLPYKIGALAAGKPYQAPTAAPLDPALFPNYEAVYREVQMGYEVPVMVQDGKLEVALPTGNKDELIPLSATEFALKSSITRITFTLDEQGKAQSLVVHGFYGPGSRAERTDKPLPSQRAAVSLDPALFDRYTGEYELAPGQNIRFTRADDHLVAHVPGQPDYQLFAESETKFFLKDLPVTFEFQKDASGKVTGVLLNQAGREMPAKKVK